jgi:hypothetical protein
MRRINNKKKYHEKNIQIEFNNNPHERFITKLWRPQSPRIICF